MEVAAWPYESAHVCHIARAAPRCKRPHPQHHSPPPGRSPTPPIAALNLRTVRGYAPSQGCSAQRHIGGDRAGALNGLPGGRQGDGPGTPTLPPLAAPRASEAPQRLLRESSEGTRGLSELSPHSHSEAPQWPLSEALSVATLRSSEGSSEGNQRHSEVLISNQGAIRGSSEAHQGLIRGQSQALSGRRGGAWEGRQVEAAAWPYESAHGCHIARAAPRYKRPHLQHHSPAWSLPHSSHRRSQPTYSTGIRPFTRLLGASTAHRWRSCRRS